ncbi:MAG: hypothetical protein JNJ54_33080 [Myxococcaceae bacterium]|nr:hypothetical protein [Myxococcaceae bacterium]
MKPLAALLTFLTLGAAEQLGDTRYRAVTLEPAQRKMFRVADLEKVTAASGRCIEEGMDVDEPQTFWLEATCGGVRTTFAWKKDGTRVHVMACAEDAKRSSALVKLRQRVQQELKAMKSVTACVRGERVELWGWALSPKERDAVSALANKHGLENHVELLGDEAG